MPSPRKIKATFIQTLVNYDGPILVSLKYRNSNMLAVAIDPSDYQREWIDSNARTFFGCFIPKRIWDKYINGKSDLYHVFESTNSKNFYFFDINTIEKNKIFLYEAYQDEIEDRELYWPERGFFSASHTEEIQGHQQIESAKQTFAINGSWDTVDFSGFYAKISDLYALFFADNHIGSHASNNLASTLKTSIISKLWRGGGSYTGFYKGMEHDFPDMEHLKVNKIQYASPGEIELTGDGEIFDVLTRSFNDFKGNESETKKLYDFIDQLLSKEKLKKADPNSNFSSNATEESTKEKCDKILKHISIQNIDDIYNTCGKNTLIYAKLTLSAYRRFIGIYKYIQEGRVNY